MNTDIQQVSMSKDYGKKVIRLSIPRNEIMVIIVTDDKDLVDCQGASNAVVRVREINPYGENQSSAAVAAFQIIHLDGREERVVPVDWSIMYEHESDKTVSVEEVLDDNSQKRKDRP